MCRRREVVQWALDGMIDERTGPEPGWTCYMMSDEECDLIVRTTPKPTLEEAMEWLMDRGQATFMREG